MEGEADAFYKIRSLSILFKLRKLPRKELKEMCKVLGISYIDLMCDMPVRWNSTDRMLGAALRMEKAIRAVLYNQEWDSSVRSKLTPTDDDWATLKEMSVFFDIFRKPTIKSQADHYPTLHNVIPDYLYMMHQLNNWQLQTERPILQKAAIAAHAVLTNYFKKSLATRHSLVATLCDPRYKMKALAFFSQAEGGFDSGLCKKEKAHLQHVYSIYSRRAIGIKEYYRKLATDEAIDSIEARSPSPKVGEDN